MPKWIDIIFICIIYGFFMEPISKTINHKVNKKWLAYILTFVVGVCILLVLYGIADICRTLFNL